MLSHISRRSGAAVLAPLASRGALAPASALLRHTNALVDRNGRASTFAPPLHQRELSSRPSTLSKMGTLSVDPLASSSTVQGVEYVLTGFDKLVNWARKSSMWPMTFGLA